MNIWLGQVSVSQVETLEMIFADLTENGWVIPGWLVDLRSHVENRS